MRILVPQDMCGLHEVNHLSEVWLLVSKTMGTTRVVKQIPCEASVVGEEVHTY